MKTIKTKAVGKKAVPKKATKKRTTNSIIIIIIIISGITGAFLGSSYAPPPAHGDRPPHVPDIEQDPHNYLMVIKTTITTVNMVISLILIALYFKIYHEVRSDFTIGLIVVMFALLIYSLTSNPLLPFIFGFRSFGIGIFLIIPDMFATLSLATLLYLSLK